MYVSLLNTDATLLWQNKLLKAGDALVDLSQVRSLRFMSPRKVLEEVNLNLSQVPVGLSFLGSGDYHHLTLLFLKKIPLPFTLIVLDWHLDLNTAPPGFVSCGSWLREALNLSQVEEVYVLGVQEEMLPGVSGHLRSAGEMVKFKIYPARTFPLAIRVVPQEVEGRMVYISLDKDVLAPPFAWTTWDQGELHPGPIFYLLRSLKNKARVIGVDVCGEYSPTSVVLGPYELAKVQANEIFNIALLKLFTGSKRLKTSAKVV
ncbi:arginase family protein [Thermanaeromonas toyohensis]|nr:arginase family protein [Thermanaeromonas toyohensis]